MTSQEQKSDLCTKSEYFGRLKCWTGIKYSFSGWMASNWTYLRIQKRLTKNVLCSTGSELQYGCWTGVGQLYGREGDGWKWRGGGDP
jgi:hypothetical protein